MTLPLQLDVRRVIPRWRNLRMAFASGELAFPGQEPARDLVRHQDFREKKALWERNPKVEFAAELVASALVGGLEKDAIDAAEFIILNEANTTPSVYAIAEELLIRAGKLESKSRINAIPILHPQEELYARIRNIRRSLNRFPGNSLTWVDFSRAYLIVGHLPKARRAMLNALTLEPENRFVLRSASRLFVHLDEPDLAHQILIQRSVTPQDPWLLAAEISTAAILGNTSKLMKRARSILAEDNFDPYHVAELASAVATVELSMGAARKARQLFEKSLRRPTENSVAQSVWAKQWLNGLEIDTATDSTPRTFEAKALNSYLFLSSADLLAMSSLWLADEPFSSRPAIFGSYTASILFEDFPSAEEFSRIGLRSNPMDSTLINNLAFSLAKQDKTDEALRLIRTVARPTAALSTDIALEATEGLIYVRQGNIDLGKVRYLRAIELARKNSMPKLQALASVYYAQEMFQAGVMPVQEALTLAEEATKRISSPDVTFFFTKFKKSIDK